MSDMQCPKCGSTDLIELSNLHEWWACRSCGYQDYGAEFDAGTADTDDLPDGTCRHGWAEGAAKYMKDSLHDPDPGPDPCPHNDDPTTCWECNGIYDEP